MVKQGKLYRFGNFLKAVCLHPLWVRSQRLWEHAERDSLEFLLFGQDLDEQPAEDILEAVETYVRACIEAGVIKSNSSLEEGIFFLLINLEEHQLISVKKSDEVCGLLGPKSFEAFLARRQMSCPANEVRALLIDTRMRAAGEIATDLTDIPVGCTDPMSCTMRTVLLRDHAGSSVLMEALKFTPIKECQLWCSENPHGNRIDRPDARRIELAVHSEGCDDTFYGVKPSIA